MNIKRRLTKGFKFTRYFDDIDKGYRFDVHYKGKNVAYALTKPSSEGDGPWLAGIHVIPDFQDKGLGQYLMRRVETFYKGKTIRLRARPYKGKQISLKGLVEFYTKLGYKPYDKEHRMYKKIK